MTNLEGRVLLRHRAVEPPRGVRSDLEILAGLAERLGYKNGFPSEPRAVFDELPRASSGGAADYSGITYERIDAEGGVFWPCSGEKEPRHTTDVSRPLSQRRMGALDFTRSSTAPRLKSPTMIIQCI